MKSGRKPLSVKKLTAFVGIVIAQKVKFDISEHSSRLGFTECFQIVDESLFPFVQVRRHYLNDRLLPGAMGEMDKWLIEVMIRLE